MPFFPNYTDHGVEHLERVLATELQLIPEEVFDENLLTAGDIAVLVTSTLLHDIGMHIREQGFLELVAEDTKYQPVEWFTRDGNSDRSWSVLWQEFQEEVLRYGDREIIPILGPPPENDRADWKPKNAS